MGVVVGDCAIYQYHTVSYHESICGYFWVKTDNKQMINPRALLPHTRLSAIADRICRTQRSLRLRFAPGSSAPQQTGEILVHDEHDARTGEYANDVRAEARVEPCETLVRPGVRDHGRDGAVVHAREHRVTLFWLLVGIELFFLVHVFFKLLLLTWMRERTTCYGYVAHSAPIFDAPEMAVYVVLDFTRTKQKNWPPPPPNLV